MSVTVVKLIDGADLGTSASTLYTSPANTRTIIDQFTICNHTAGAVTVTLHLVQSGGSVAANNKVLDAKSIAANEAYVVSELRGHVLEAGDFISGLAGAGTSISAQASGRQVV